MLSTILDRQRARYESERVDTTGEDLPASNTTATNDDDDDAPTVQQPAVTTEATPPLVVETVSDDEEDSSSNNSNNTATDADTDLEQGHTDDDDTAEFTHRLTLAQLEEERELVRRRSSLCVMVAVFVLFRLWLLAMQTGDFGLLLLSLVGTSWTARWVRYTRDREDEMDRRIADFRNNNNNTNNNNDLRLLSFQAQLALAIMESQRQMMENGGYGNEEAPQPGVSTQAKTGWEHFSFKTVPQYGSVQQQQQQQQTNDLEQQQSKNEQDEEEPHCSICLSEYQDAEALVRLPCSHIYHDECIASWTNHHTKCPLCNFDLQAAAAPLQ